MSNPVTHWQILTKQPERAEAFYGGLFGWRFSGDNPLGYRTVNTGSEEGIEGGFWPIGDQDGPSMAQLFIRVDNVASTIRQARELGGGVVIPPQVLPGGDKIAILTDPDGVPFGIHRPGRATPSATNGV